MSPPPPSADGHGHGTQLPPLFGYHLVNAYGLMSTVYGQANGTYRPIRVAGQCTHSHTADQTACANAPLRYISPTHKLFSAQVRRIDVPERLSATDTDYARLAAAIPRAPSLPR